MKAYDLTDKTFGNWKVLNRDYTKNNGRSNWLCECQCSKRTLRIVDGYSLTSGRSISCGCIRDEVSRARGFIVHQEKIQRIEKQKEEKSLIGKVFGFLQVLEKVNSNSHHSYYRCKCLKCNSIITVRGTNLTSGKTISCGCIKSRGEEIISQILTENNIQFIREKTFSDCILPTGGYARFDFYINNQYLIEYDGETHYTSNGGWNNAENYERTRLSDKYKNQWCKEHNILLIRIPYTHLKQISVNDLLPNSSFIVN